MVWLLLVPPYGKILIHHNSGWDTYITATTIWILVLADNVPIWHIHFFSGGLGWPQNGGRGGGVVDDGKRCVGDTHSHIFRETFGAIFAMDIFWPIYTTIQCRVVHFDADQMQSNAEYLPLIWELKLSQNFNCGHSVHRIQTTID